MFLARPVQQRANVNAARFRLPCALTGAPSSVGVMMAGEASEAGAEISEIVEEMPS
jgi:hypothetical protein